MSCIDLIITDQPNTFIESCVHPSLDDHCQHEIVHGKISISIPCSPPYNRTLWDFAKSTDQAIRIALSSVEWVSQFDGLDTDQMTELFTNEIYSITSVHIPNKVVKCNDKDRPWMTQELKTAIKRKLRVFGKFIRRGKRQEDWDDVRAVPNDTAKMIANAKDRFGSSTRVCSRSSFILNLYKRQKM